MDGDGRRVMVGGGVGVKRVFMDVADGSVLLAYPTLRVVVGVAM